MSNSDTLVFKESKSNEDIADIYNFNVHAFADSQDFDWSEKNIKKEIKDGWHLFSVEYEDDIVAALFLKQSDGQLLTKNTPIKMEFQGNGFSHMIKDFYEEYAQDNEINTIVNYCPLDNFRMISLNEGHDYVKKGSAPGENKELLVWEKKLK